MKPERIAYQDEIELVVIVFTLFCIFISWALLTLPSPPPPAPVAPVETPTPLPTPTPTAEPTLSVEQMMAETGGLHMGEWLSWQRKNVSGYQDMSSHITVYGYRMFGTIDWYSVSWGKYYKQGAGDNEKFLFVFVNFYSDQDMARMWGIQPNQFAVQVKQEVYLPSEVLLPEIRIKQFDDIWNLDHIENLKPYGYLRTYDRTGKPTVESLGYIKAGKSNAWDGYIVFVVPKDTQAKDIKVLAQFGDLIEPHWWQLQ